jgi:group I intron endonuclease
MGIIYLITFPNKKIYIGQTRQELNKRIKQHINCSKDTLISRAFSKYKDYDVKILIETCNETLDDEEIKYINLYDTLSPNGYNLRSGGQQGYRFTQEVKQKCSNSQRKHDKSLPMYIYKVVKSPEGYKCRPPDGRQEKYFTSIQLSDEIKLSLAKEYLVGEVTYLQDKYTLPKYISKVVRPGRSGYRVTIPGKCRYFSSGKLSDEDKLKKAIEYLKLTIKQEEGSTTK